MNNDLLINWLNLFHNHSILFGILVYFSFLNQNNLFLFEKKYLTYINDKAFEVNEEIFKEGEES